MPIFTWHDGNHAGGVASHARHVDLTSIPGRAGTGTNIAVACLIGPQPDALHSNQVRTNVTPVGNRPDSDGRTGNLR